MAQLKQISRPFQIALVAVIVLFALWFVVLRHASSESTSPSASSSQPATTSQPAASSSSSGSSGSPASGTSTYHGSAPGVAGLTRAIAKARGAVAQSQQNAQRLQSKEKQASSASSAAQATAAKPTSATNAKSGASATTAPAKTKVAPQTAAKPSSAARAKAGVPVLQSRVEAQLKHGQLVAILLWNPKGSVDKVVHSNLLSAKQSFAGKLAVHVATSGQVGSFGTFTRTVQVYSTPTILLINPKGATSSVTGLTDSFAIDQAIREAEQAG